MDEYVEPIREQIRKLKANVKSDTNIEMKDFNLNFKMFQRQEEAKQMDEEDRNRILDNLREGFGALQAGEMLDFIDAVEQA